MPIPYKYLTLATLLTIGLSHQTVSALPTPEIPTTPVNQVIIYPEPRTPIAVEELPTLEPIQQTLPTAPSGTYPNAYEPNNCTSYVASRKPIPNNWGNAKNWLANAIAQGYTVSDVPIVGAVAVDTSGVYGHTAVVVGVGLGTVTVDEANYDWHGSIRTYTYTTSHFRYIYL